jgi:exosortase
MMRDAAELASARKAKVSTSWPLALGFAALAFPAVLKLGSQTWSSEEGAHGPLVLCTGAWLIWRQLPELRRDGELGQARIVFAGLCFALPMYIFGEAFDFISLEISGLYLIGLLFFYSRFGAFQIARNWFVFLYLAFAIPPPRTWLDSLTFPLKQLVSATASALLRPFGVPVTHEGVAIYVAQYQYLVEDACSGLNSIVGLMAIGLLYVYLARRGTWLYSAVLAALILPIAFAANVIRIAILILLTQYFGDDVAQGFMHFASGMVVFAIALIVIFSVDALMALTVRRYGKLA